MKNASAYSLLCLFFSVFRVLASWEPLSFLVAYCRAVDVKQEKQHNDLIHGVETFSPHKLKHTDTLEKVILPNAEGMYSLVLVCTGCLLAFQTFKSK